MLDLVGHPGDGSSCVIAYVIQVKMIIKMIQLSSDLTVMS